MVQSFLKFIETYSVVEVHIKVSIRVSHSAELFLDLDPKQVQHSVKKAALVFWDVRRCALCVGREHVVQIA